MLKKTLCVITVLSAVACSNPSTTNTNATTEVSTSTNNLATTKVESAMIIPGKKFDKITATTTVAELEELYGKENVEAGLTYSPPPVEKEIMYAALYPNTADALQIVWEDAEESKIQRITFSRPNGKWEVNGCKIGTSIEDVEKMNGTVFKILGFPIADDGSGSVIDWGGGDLAGNDKWEVNFGIDYEKLAEYPELMEDKLRSDAPALKSANAKIKYISIYF